MSSAGEDDVLDTAVAIETPEHIVFHHRLAGPARRAAAHLIDLVLCYTAVAVLVAVVLLSTQASTDELGSSAKAGMGIVLVALFVVQWVYFVVWEALRGASPGKRWLGLRVLTTTGRSIGWRGAALRNLLRAADLFPVGYLTGVIAVAATRRFQRLGDLVAGTIVVVPDATFREGTRAHARLELRPAAQPKEIATLPDEVTLDADEREAIELFLRRRHALGRAREHELASMIAGDIGKRLGFRHEDPARLLALVYDRAVNAGRNDAPPSSLSRRPKAPKASARDRSAP
ncbi:MAG: RDD family protein [Deltaproteobacteria bacterium]|nr:RDD family protein [Deltaproteobacteria bacterium]